MAFELADAPINVGQFTKELEGLKLPSFEGVSRLSRRETDNVWESSDPYIVIRCGRLTAAKQKAIRDALTAHVPAPDPPDARSAKIDAMGVSDEDKATLKELFGVGQ